MRTDEKLLEYIFSMYETYIMNKKRKVKVLSSIVACLVIATVITVSVVHFNRENDGGVNNILTGEPNLMTNHEPEDVETTPPLVESVAENEDIIVWSDVNIDTERLVAGTRVSGEEWAEHFLFTLPEITEYYLVYSHNRPECLDCITFGAVRQGCATCDLPTHLIGWRFIIRHSDGQWLSAGIVKITDETSMLDVGASEVLIGGVVVPVDEVSRISDTEVVLSRIHDEAFGETRAFGAFGFGGYTITFESLGFDENMIVDFVGAFNPDAVS